MQATLLYEKQQTVYGDVLCSSESTDKEEVWCYYYGREELACSCISTSLTYLEETVIITFCSLPPRVLACGKMKFSY